MFIFTRCLIYNDVLTVNIILEVLYFKNVFCTPYKEKLNENKRNMKYN